MAEVAKSKVQSFISTLESMPDMEGSYTAGKKMTLKLPLGRAFEKLVFYLKGSSTALTEAQMKNDVAKFEISIAGTPKVDADGTFVIDRQSYYHDNLGYTYANNGIFVWNFTRPYLRAAAAERAMRLGTKDIKAANKSVVVEITWNASSITCDDIAVYAERSDDDVSGDIIAVRRLPQTFASTGEHSISDLRRERGEKLVAMHILQGARTGSGSGTIDSVELKINNTPFYDVPSDVNDQMLKACGRVPQTGYFHVDFLRKNVLKGAIPTEVINDMRLAVTWSSAAPNTYDVYQETLEPAF